MTVRTAMVIINVAVLAATTFTCIYSGPWGLVCLLGLVEAKKPLPPPALPPCDCTLGQRWDPARGCAVPCTVCKPAKVEEE